MKPHLKISMMALTIISSTAFAVNPINGIYAGIILGGTYTPKTQLSFPSPIIPNSDPCASTTLCSVTTGTLDSSAFGNIGGQVGMRFDHLRVELEPVANYNPYKQLMVGTTRYSDSKFNSVRIAGNTTTAAVFLNGMYDFYTPKGESQVAPYLGAGIGYAHVVNENRFYLNNETIPCTVFKTNTNSPVAQAIIGTAYFLDDFSWFGLDYRYITTRKIDVLNSRLQLHTINLSFNGTFY